MILLAALPIDNALALVCLATFWASNSQTLVAAREDPFLRNGVARQDAEAEEDPLLARARARMERINSEMVETVRASAPASGSAQQGSDPLDGYAHDWRERLAGMPETVHASIPTPWEGPTIVAQAVTNIRYFLGFLIGGFLMLWLLSRAIVFVFTVLSGRSENTPWLAFDVAVYGSVVVTASNGFADGGPPRFWYAFGMYLLPALAVVILDAPRDRTFALASVAARRRWRRLRRSISGAGPALPQYPVSSDRSPDFESEMQTSWRERWSKAYTTVQRHWRIALGLVAVISLAWWFRYDVQRCDSSKCVVLDRWTGEVFRTYPPLRR